MLDSTNQYISLDRTFFDFQEDDDIEDVAMRSYLATIRNNILDWDTLLQSRCVVILGEPGSGKTWEMENQVKLIREGGNYAFFLRLEQLLDSHNSLSTLLSLEDNEKYVSWKKRRQQEAIFFLDAKDEAALKTTYALNDALTNFVNYLGRSNLSAIKVKVVISCRISEWKTAIDEKVIHSHFTNLLQEQDNSGNSKKPKDSKEQKIPALRIVQLVPLDEEQMKKLVEAKGIEESERFFQEVNKNSLWAFMGRPLDVKNMAYYWENKYKDNHHFDTWKIMVEYDVERKLKQHGEPHSRNEPFFNDKEVRLAAEMLAASVLFCKEFKFSLQEGSTNIQGIPPTKVLPDWDKKKANAILNRPLFDEATYGYVRFHHRQVVEYLAVSWLQTCLENGCSFSKVESLLFVKCYDKTVIPPSREPIAAWLAIIKDESWNEKIRQRLIQEYPEILLYHGDPQSLTVEDRRKLLSKLASLDKEQQKIEFNRFDIDEGKLASFGTPELAKDFSKHLCDKTLSDDLRELLLLIVTSARLSDCISAVLEILQTQDEDEHLKFYAALAIRDVGLRKHRKELGTIVNNYQTLSGYLCNVVCQTLYPEIIDVNGLIKLLAKGSDIDEDSFSMTLNELITEAPANDFEVWLKQLNHLLGQPPFVNATKGINLSSHYKWLGSALGNVVQRLLQQRNTIETELTSDIVQSLLLLGSYNEGRTWPTKKKIVLTDELEKHPKLRHAYLWEIVLLFKSQNPDRVLYWHNLLHYPLITTSFMYSDIVWLLDYAANLSTKREQLIAFETALGLWKPYGCKWKYRKYFLLAAKKKPQLQQILQKEVENSIFCFFKRQWAIYKPNQRELKDKFNAISVNIKNKNQHIRYYIWLLRHSQSLRNGKKVDDLILLMGEAGIELIGREAADWRSLKPIYGNYIANVAREGWKTFWKTYTPVLPQEKDEPSRTDYRVFLGLTGLKTAVDDGLKLDSLSFEEAQTAAIYAVNKRNGFPDWFSELASVHQLPVKDILLKCIKTQLHIPLSSDQPYEILGKLTYADQNLQTIVVNELCELLSQVESIHFEVLIQALTRILKSSKQIKLAVDLAPLAKQQLQTLKYDDKTFMVWLVVWIQVDDSESCEAIEFLQNILTNTISSPNAFMEKFCAKFNFHMSRYPQCKNPAYLQPKALEKFIPLIYKYVRRNEDIEHGGEAFTPTTRDEAQEFRGYLLAQLADSSEPETYHILQRLAKHPALADSQKFVYRLLERHIKRSAEGCPWKPEDIANFCPSITQQSINFNDPVMVQAIGNGNTIHNNQ